MGGGIASKAHPMAFSALLEQREECPPRLREVLFDIGDDHPLQRGFMTDSFDGRIKLAQRHHRFHLGVLELIFELAWGVERVYGGDHGAGLQCAIEGDEELWAVREHEGDPISWL